MVTSNHIHLSRKARDFASSTCVDAGGRGVIPKAMHLIAGHEPGRNIIKGKTGKVHSGKTVIMQLPLKVIVIWLNVSFILIFTLLNSLTLPCTIHTFLQGAKDGKFYKGFTQDLKLRFEHHNNGLIKFTKYIRPLELIYYEACIDRSDSTRREKYFKTHHGKMFLRKRLKSYLTG
jgi:putative endonuclease